MTQGSTAGEPADGDAPTSTVPAAVDPIDPVPLGSESDDDLDEDLDESDKDDEDDEDEDEPDEDEDGDEPDEDEDDVAVAPGAADPASGGAASSAGRRSETGTDELFHESEIAADYLEGLLDILDYDGDIDEVVQNGRPTVEIVGDRLDALVGPRGATLEALQELTRLAVYRETGAPSRLLLDIGGFRADRRRELGVLARNAAEKVKEFGDAVTLEPMSAFERKCVHDVITGTAGVRSESEGVEPSRRVVVLPES